MPERRAQRRIARWRAAVEEVLAIELTPLGHRGLRPPVGNLVRIAAQP